MVTDSGQLSNNAQCAQERREDDILARLDAATGVGCYTRHPSGCLCLGYVCAFPLLTRVSLRGAVTRRVDAT